MFCILASTLNFQYAFLKNIFFDVDSLVAQMVKTLPAMLGDPGSIPGLGRSPGEGNGNPLQYSCLENSMDGGAWQVTVHGVTKHQTRLRDFHFSFLKIFIEFVTILLVGFLCFFFFFAKRHMGS